VLEFRSVIVSTDRDVKPAQSQASSTIRLETHGEGTSCAEPKFSEQGTIAYKTGPLPNWESCAHRSSWGVYAGKIPLYPHRLLAYYNPMLPPERTPRQRIIELLTGTRLTTHQLAQMLAIPERQVEDHLVHVVKSIARNKTSRFVLEPSRCQDCDFVFRDRRRLTKPSRCPQCRSEAIAPPRYGIDSVGSQSGRVDSNVRGQ